MYDSKDEQDLEVSGVETGKAPERLSRRSRARAEAAAEPTPAPASDPSPEKAESREERKASSKLAPAPVFLTLLWSIIVSAVSVANPLLTGLATNLQSQNLYAGWVMSQGQLPYVGFYGTGGLLYYFLVWMGSLVFGQLLLMVFQAVALWIAGIYLYKTLAAITRKSELARSLLSLFYLLVLTLGFGGLYASIFAFPFIFGSLYFLVKYIQDTASDEAFLVFGAVAALAFMVEPVYSFIFYAISSLVLMVYNIIARRKARGIYQFLAALVGFSIVFYPLGYITVWNGSFGQAINQVTYLVNAFNLTGSHLVSNLIFYGLLVLGLGLASAFVMNFRAKIERSSARVLQINAFLGLLLVIVVALALPEQGAYQLLPVLPYAMILFGLWLNKESKPSGKHRRDRRRRSIWSAYLSGQFFLPLLAMLYLVISPVVQEYILSSGLASERATVARHIRSNSDRSDMIYAWDRTASLYQASQRASASPLLSPALYMGTSENQLTLRNNLNSANPKFILVNNDLEVNADVQEKISQNYQEVNLNLRRFKLYQVK